VGRRWVRWYLSPSPSYTAGGHIDGMVGTRTSTCNVAFASATTRGYSSVLEAGLLPPKSPQMDPGAVTTASWPLSPTFHPPGCSRCQYQGACGNPTGRHPALPALMVAMAPRLELPPVRWAC